MASRPWLTITFVKAVRHAAVHAWWEAERRTGGTVRGAYMPIGRNVIPHDLVHYAAEATLGIEDGFWGLIARGGTFARGTDQKPTRRGRALVAAHRTALDAAERLGNAHHRWWREGQPTPVADAFDALAASWQPVPDGGSLTVHWPASREPGGALPKITR